MFPNGCIAAVSPHMNWIRRPALLLCCAWLLAWAAPSRADDAAEVQRLVKSGQTVEALALLERAIAARPRDAQLRFLKGVVLAGSGRTTEATAVFVALNEDFPELAEPYNNLAVLYAAQGEFDKARVALESAVRANPSYTTAYENLGDLYLRLAARAYTRALTLDATNATLAPKVAQVKAMVPDRPAEAAAKSP